jgi:phosphate transport system substrate-binding protein
MKRWKIPVAALAALSMITAACGGDDDSSSSETTAAPETTAAADGGDDAPETTAAPEPEPAADLAGTLSGAGATFPNPVFQEWAFDYNADVQSGVSVDYASIGSGGGIEQFLLQTVDFGASERYLRDDALASALEDRGCEAVQFPVLFGAVVVAFGDDQFDGLVLSAEVIAAIFQREITNYNDPAIAELNPDRDLPDLEMIPVHRSDGSGTTSVFTTYLEDAAANWTLGSGTEVQWPAGTIGGQGNEGVTVGIEQNAGGIGYVNQAYALVNSLPTALVINADGNAVEGSLEATTEALDVLEIPDSFQFDILNVGGGGYPIVGAVWVFVYECGYDDNTAAMLIDYWTWATQSAQAKELAENLGYPTLGPGLQPRVLAAIERINSAE